MEEVRRAGAGFPKSHRLLRRSDFARAQRAGVSARGKHAVVVVHARGDERAARLGIIATRKIGSAVERNRAKRRIREWFRRASLPPGFDVVVIPQASAHAVSAALLWESLDHAARKAVAKACGAGPAASR